MEMQENGEPLKYQKRNKDVATLVYHRHDHPLLLLLFVFLFLSFLLLFLKRKIIITGQSAQIYAGQTPDQKSRTALFEQ